MEQKNSNEIAKKLLYKLKPIAKLVVVKKGYLRYHTYCGSVNIYFHVPFEDIGDAEFLPEMPAHLLNRYIYSNDGAIDR